MALGVTTFRRTVTTAGTAVPLSTSDLFTQAYVIRALSANSGIIYVGDSSSATSTNGMFLAAGEANEKAGSKERNGIENYFNLKNIFINSSVSGEGVIVEYLTGN